MAFCRQLLNAKGGLLLMNRLIDRRPVVQENLILFDEGDDAHDDEGDASDDEGEGKTVPYEEEENDDAEQHQFSVI